MRPPFIQAALGALAFLIGLVVSMSMSRGVKTVPQGIARSDTKAKDATLQVPTTISGKPKHHTFDAALSEPDTFEKVFSLNTLLASANIADFPKIWHQIEADAIANELLVGIWLERDLPGLARQLAQLPLTHIFYVISRVSNTTPEGRLPRAIRDSLMSLSLRASTENEQLIFLRNLHTIDPALAESVADNSSPKLKREVDSMSRWKSFNKLIKSDPRKIAGPQKTHKPQRNGPVA
ncbi:MAG: hypothetical protein ACI9R3_004624 [Verrucomicrobiales bacterium]|jgi:hypothetical protein